MSSSSSHSVTNHKKPLWEAETPLGKVYITDDWFSDPGKYVPFWNGCGISPGFVAMRDAKDFTIAWLKRMRGEELAKAEKRVAQLEEFNPETL